MMIEAAQINMSVKELTIEETGDRTVIKVPTFFNPRIFNECCIILIGTTILIGISVFASYGKIAAGNLADGLGVVLFLLIIAALWFAAVRIVAWYLSGHEVLLVDNGAITYSRFVAGTEHSSVYLVSRISSIRWVDLSLHCWYGMWYDASYPDRLLINRNPGSCVEFRCGAELYCFAVGSGKDVGEKIVAALLNRIGGKS
jgi:hypothetical protein